MKVSFIGGDLRTLRLVHRFLSTGAEVACFGLLPPLQAQPLVPALAGADAVILPLPASRDGHTVASCTPAVSLKSVLQNTPPAALLLGGALSPAFIEEAKKEGKTAIDYYAGEALLQKNAALTAESALALASLAAMRSLFESETAVVGSGRVANALIFLMEKIGVPYRVYARSPEKVSPLCKKETVAFQMAETLHFPRETDVVFSTLPTPVFGERTFSSLAPGTLFYDLGNSVKDREAAEKRGILLPPAKGLPGKYQSDSAGDALFTDILAIIEKERGFFV